MSNRVTTCDQYLAEVRRWQGKGLSNCPDDVLAVLNAHYGSCPQCKHLTDETVYYSTGSPSVIQGKIGNN